VIEREPADSAEAIRVLSERDAELGALYAPEDSFRIPVGEHVSENILFLMARENGVPVGCGALALYRGYAELKSIYVTPEARGRKLGAEIVGALERLAQASGFSDVKLETGIHSPAAIRTYETLGYRQCERFGDYPDAPLSIFMEKRLTTI
jgi:putative acetyltransferase